MSESGIGPISPEDARKLQTPEDAEAERKRAVQTIEPEWDEYREPLYDEARSAAQRAVRKFLAENEEGDP